VVRKTFLISRALTAVAVFLAAGCSGNGEGLNSYGQPLGKEQAALRPDFASLKAAILDPQCGACHSGPSSAKNLDLSGPDVYIRLTGPQNASLQQPGMMQIAPGNPDSSYFYLKMIGKNIIEARMPKDRAPLEKGELTVVREWIEKGAPEKGEGL